MNKLEQFAKERGIKQLLSYQDRMHVNCIRINAHNSIGHESVKFEICYSLAKQGKNFITEATFLKREQGRADIINITDSEITEIVNSEKDESIELKRKKYPLPLNVISLGGSSG